jgi:ABC-2 type transport system permease protein
VIRALLARHARHQRALLISLCGGLALLEWLLVVIVDRIETGPGMLALFEQIMPPGIRALLAPQLGMVSFGGLVAFGFTHPAALVAVIAFVVVVGTVPAGERESGLLDLILSRPVPRSRYFVALVLLLAVGAVLLPLSLVAGAGVALAGVDNPDELPWTRYLHAAGGLTALLLAIGGYTLFFAAGSTRRGRATALAVGLTVVLFWIDMLARLWSPLEHVQWLSPFHYYDPMGAVIAGGAPPEHPIVLLGIFVIATAAALLRFHRQNL